MTKYRAIRKDNGEWVYGYYFCNGEEHGITDNKSVIGVWYKVTPESLALFTTLHDKNGKEIFGSIPVNGVMSRGGDVVIEVCEYSAYRSREMKIIFGVTGWTLYEPIGNNTFEISPAYKLEIIGNQYDEEG